MRPISPSNAIKAIWNWMFIAEADIQELQRDRDRLERILRATVKAVIEVNEFKKQIDFLEERVLVLETELVDSKKLTEREGS